MVGDEVGDLKKLHPVLFNKINELIDFNGGRGGIRTHGGVAPTAVFKTAALNHSATLPERSHLHEAR
jgi:hypothetical protein